MALYGVVRDIPLTAQNSTSEESARIVSTSGFRQMLSGWVDFTFLQTKEYSPVFKEIFITLLLYLMNFAYEIKIISDGMANND